MIDSQSQKDVLYLALYFRDGILPSSALKDDRYHWALLAIPSHDKNLRKHALRFHARDYYSSPDQTHWIYEEIHVDARGTPKLLAQIRIGDILDTDRLLEILRDVPIVQDLAGWNCIEWIKDALDSLEMDAEAVRGGLDWVKLRKLGLSAADAKMAGRADARKLAML
jgi:hypothetical protein